MNEIYGAYKFGQIHEHLLIYPNCNVIKVTKPDILWFIVCLPKTACSYYSILKFKHATPLSKTH